MGAQALAIHHRLNGAATPAPLRHGAVSLIDWPGNRSGVVAWLQREALACVLLPTAADSDGPIRYWPPSDLASLPSAGPAPAGTLISFSLLALQLQAQPAGPDAKATTHLHPDLLRPQVIPLLRPHQLVVLQAIRSAVGLIQQACSLAPATPLAALALDGLLLRSTALLLLPPGEVAGAAEPPNLERAVEQAMAWMLANLDRAISLGDLEEQVRYSRRSLQLGFRQRVGCGPIQWLRRQRLKAAHDQIVSMAERQGPTAGLAAVARRCGYSTLSGLSRDFSALYGYSPSRLLRQSGRPAD